MKAKSPLDVLVKGKILKTFFRIFLKIIYLNSRRSKPSGALICSYNVQDFQWFAKRFGPRVSPR
ncbi:hypothetical protein D2U88_08405 [Flagellimonas aequoris]|uniref:Uncharacterized protein n=1 Tax=Flagellimonas aequoris TaxID=2306997 RepID=A0A418N858_9FLAO|nr:hypothetical protein D2U88_08405 [Allomuricauda aequoris]